MNQIIYNNNNDNEDVFDDYITDTQIEENKHKFKLKFNFNFDYKNFLFKVLFIFSSSLSLMFLIHYILFNYSIDKNEKISKTLSNNFEVKTLYSSNSGYSTNLDVNNYVIGIIEINSININYPIISESTDENLKISPCKFYGPSPNEVGNLCIVAHNYNNYKFFSKIYKLNVGDVITIYDLSGKKIDYYVYDKFEVNYDNLDCLNQDTNGNREITLITCNNLEDTKRIIVKAIENPSNL